MKGVFENGKFRRCAEYPAGYPQCMGRAAAHPDRASDMCTCFNFTTDQMRFAREHELTIQERAHLPEEWRSARAGFASVLDELDHWKERALEAERELREREQGVARIGNATVHLHRDH